MKGVLAIAHAKQRFVYHAVRRCTRTRLPARRIGARRVTFGARSQVHMIFSGAFAEEWGEEEARESKLVFIGKNLDAKALAEGFDDCIASEANMQASAQRIAS
jgi:G3E family GTPase